MECERQDSRTNGVFEDGSEHAHVVALGSSIFAAGQHIAAIRRYRQRTHLSGVSLKHVQTVLQTRVPNFNIGVVAAAGQHIVAVAVYREAGDFDGMPLEIVRN